MRFPLIPSILVGLAVAAMLGLGIWQLVRKGEKERQIAELSANAALPPIAYPELGPLADESLFRRSSVMCLAVTGWTERAGRAADGSTGYAQIAQCRTGADGPGARVLAGIAPRPGVEPEWRGGLVEGLVMPYVQPGLADQIGLTAFVREPMLVAAAGQGGLATPARPTAASVSNNHLAYAIQWFVFAGAAAIIYLLALRRRQRRADATPPPA